MKPLPRETRAALAGGGLILPVFVLAHFSHHVVTGALVPLLPHMRDELGLDYLGSGMLVSAFTLTYGIVQVPLAILSDRISRRKLIAFGLFGTGLASTLMVFANAYWQVVALLVAIGAFGSTYHAPASAFLSQTFDKENRGRSLGLHTVGGSGSLLVTPLLAVFLAYTFGSWRIAYLILGIVPILVGLVVLTATRKQDAANIKDSVASRSERVAVLEIARLIGALVFIAMVATLLSSAVSSFMPLYLVDKHGIDNNVAGIIAGLVAGGGVIGAPLGGALSDRFGRAPVIMVTLVLAGPLLYVLTLLPFGVPLLVMITVYGVVMSARMPVMESVIADVVPAAQRGSALGVYFFLSQETAGVATPAVGYVMDLYGADPAFVLLAGIGALTGVLALFVIRRPARRQESNVAASSSTGPRSP